jgi:hypothetical protein
LSHAARELAGHPIGWIDELMPWNASPRGLAQACKTADP